MERPRFHIGNLTAIDKLYRAYQKNPKGVSPEWHAFFSGMDFASGNLGEDIESLKAYKLLMAYRKFGHLYAKTNPLLPQGALPKELSLELLGFQKKELLPGLGLFAEERVTVEEFSFLLQKIYSSTIGVEYMDLDNIELEEWIQKRFEPIWQIDLTLEEKKEIFELLNKAEMFESFLHTKFVGQKRFSLEGGETLIPILQGVIDEGVEGGLEEFVIGMAHRGRLNVLAHILEKSYSVIFHEFELALTAHKTAGTDDVKYHKGFFSKTTRQGKTVDLHLAANPSHLESVDPVVLGETKAQQMIKGEGKVAAILIHGDASLAGQGVIYESLQLMRIDGYCTGGTIHIVVNNQIGFTSLPEETRSSQYCTDIAKTFNCPVFHVNAEDPEGCCWASKLAMQIRKEFKIDVFIDLLCYRKYGHNEGDEPRFTQPLQYEKISQKQSIRDIYKEKLLQGGKLDETVALSLEEACRKKLQQALEEAKKFSTVPPAPEIVHGKEFPEVEKKTIITSVKGEILQQIATLTSKVPAGFTLHSKLAKWEGGRLKELEENLDWPFCEHLAFGSILWEGISVRLAGQDSQRGTFSQRHAVWVDQKTNEKYFPLQHLREGQGRFDILNSPLSEFAALGFEYGYSASNPNALVLWEAQYGDFVNGAQVILDQYLTSSEQKWRSCSSLVLLLPHGMEGQGPEHSSARIERFLSLAGHDNIRIVNPSTPAQLFHLLRKQALNPIKKPLIIFTPKSLLRVSACTSRLFDLTEGKFAEFLPDILEIPTPKRLLICSGKIFYEVAAKRNNQKVALLRVEQFYPFYQEKFEKVLAQYSGYQECFWLQEEPQNMGGWSYMEPILRRVLQRDIGYIGREVSASPAAGSNAVHQKEQQELIDKALL